MVQNYFGTKVDAAVEEMLGKYLDFDPKLYTYPLQNTYYLQNIFEKLELNSKKINTIIAESNDISSIEPFKPFYHGLESNHNKHLAPKKPKSLLDSNIPYFSKFDTGLDLNSEPEALPIKAEEECARYRQAIIDAPTVIPRSDLERIAGTMYAMNYSMALKEMGEVVTSKSDRLTKDKRSRIKRLLDTARTLSEHPTLSPLFSQEIDHTYGIRIVQPSEPHDKLKSDLGKVKLCWISDPRDSEPYVVNKARWLQRDTDLGACVQLIGEIDGSIDHSKIPKTYTRNYVVETREGEQALFVDTIEGGNINWSSPEEWIKANRGKELLYHLAATIYSAEVLELKKIGIGEREIQDIATAFGFREESLFDSSQSYRKLGIQPQGRSGPNTFQLDSSQTRRVINLDEITPPSLTELEGNLVKVSGFVDVRAKQMKNDPNKREEVLMYLDAIEGINHRVYRNENLLLNLRDVRDKINSYLV